MRSVDVIGDDGPDPVDPTRAETILIESQESAFADAGNRHTWEYIAALNLVIGSRAVRHR
jgi:hypothetical protein